MAKQVVKEVKAKEASLTEVMRFFGYDKMDTFRADWKNLSEEDKTFFKVGVAAT